MITVALNYRDIKFNAESVSNIKQFTNEYNWKEIKHPSNIDDWKTFEKNNLAIPLNVLYIKEKKYGLLLLEKLI